jgi:hypothetical protein
MLLATLDINRKLQTTDIVITFVLISGLTMEEAVQIQAVLMGEDLVLLAIVHAEEQMIGN